MPWEIKSNHSECPASKPFAVVKESDGKLVACHATEADAKKQLAALYASESNAKHGQSMAQTRSSDVDVSESDAKHSHPMVETRSSNVDNVDFGQRVITVIVAPYEQPAEVFYRQEIWNEVFSRSAWQGIETRQGRIPAVSAIEIPDVNHTGRIVGKVISADPNRPEGLIADVKISRTDRGDETLELAADEAVSVSAGFMVKDRHRDEVLDRRSKTRRINRAFLDHVAFVGQPAYPGARIVAMRNEGNEAEAGLPRLVTPRLDQFMNDPIFQWVADRTK